ncbi:MAG TPA: FAD-dependent oxidoreductase [Gemmatimonadaceae bacterium]|nr:FAD-dependent oxidoreductase [Gemmatimonadaceae bacterium]
MSADDVALIRAKAIAFLKAYRDAGAGAIEIGPGERLERSLVLTAGEDITERDLPMWLEELALDPWARGVEWDAPPDPERLAGFSVVVIGAGMGGLSAAVQLKHTGINFTVIEKNSGVGGTWLENRYPGARVDSPSRSYSHIFGVEFPIPWAFCPQAENQRYFDWVADEYEVRDHIHFDTEVTSVIWDEDAAEWEVTANGPEGTKIWRATAVITAVGLLSRASIPAIEGMGEFQGQLFHTSRWPDNLEVSGKRIAVIGTGCSGYQLTPELALEAGHVSLFQRKPNWVFATHSYRTPLPPQVNWLDRNLPFYTNYVRFRTHWITGPQVVLKFLDLDPNWGDDPHSRSAVNKIMRDGCIDFLEAKLGHRPELLEKMIPVHPPFSARPIAVDPDYSVLDAILRDNVTLVSDSIVRLTEKGILTRDGVEHELDVIVLATGFKANEFLWPMEVRGRDGITIDEVWAEDGPRAYIGMMVPRFPNLFMLYGPNANAYGGGGIVNIEEMVTRYAITCMKRLILEDKRSVDVTEDGYRRYNRVLDEREKLKMYSDSRAANYYRNEYGRSSTQCPFPTDVLWHWLIEPDYNEVIVS